MLCLLWAVLQASGSVYPPVRKNVFSCKFKPNTSLSADMTTASHYVMFMFIHW